MDGNYVNLIPQLPIQGEIDYKTFDVNWKPYRFIWIRFGSTNRNMDNSETRLIPVSLIKTKTNGVEMGYTEVFHIHPSSGQYYEGAEIGFLDNNKISISQFKNHQTSDHVVLGMYGII